MPGTGASSTTWVRVEIHTPCTSDRPTPIATPVGTGSRITAAAVMAISANSTERLARHRGDRAEMRTMRIATNSSSPASAACGTWASTPPPASASAATTSAASSAAACEVPPASCTIAVRGGLALTGKLPSSAAPIVGGAQPDEVAVDVGAARGRETSG